VKVLVQRVSRAEVRVQDRVIGRIGRGLLVLLGVERGDDEQLTAWYAERLIRMRLFPGQGEREWQQSVTDSGGEVLVVSQFTLPARTRKGLRPSFDRSAPPDRARELYERFIGVVADAGVPVCGGEFGAMMQVELVNDGPVTLMLEGPAEAGVGGREA
jgi:D-tyrosyl-tRNA(Tyr) deacylase